MVHSGQDINSKDMLTLNLLAEKFKNDPFKFYYVLENNYGHVWSSFESDDKGTDLVIIKGKRKRYLPVKLETEDWQSEVETVLDKVISGSGNFKNMVKKINFNKMLKDDL